VTQKKDCNNVCRKVFFSICQSQSVKKISYLNKILQLVIKRTFRHQTLPRRRSLIITGFQKSYLHFCARKLPRPICGWKPRSTRTSPCQQALFFLKKLGWSSGSHGRFPSWWTGFDSHLEECSNFSIWLN